MTEPERRHRIRRDPRDRDRRLRRGSESAAPREFKVVADSAPHVLAVVDLEAGLFSRSDRETVGAARQLADALEGAVVLLVCQAPGEVLKVRLEEAGVDRLVRVVSPAFAGYGFEARAAAAVSAVALIAPAHVVCPASPPGSDIGRRLAAELKERPAVGVVRLSPATVDCEHDGGRFFVTRPTPRIMMPAADAFAPVAEPWLREARPMALDVAMPEPRVRLLENLALDPDAIPLAEADLIVSAGNGVADWRSFHELAAALGAAEGGSRVVCDAGHLPRDRQVGASGVLVNPRCYLAFGVSGALQHLQGIAACERVVAVNIDPHAEMIARADLAIIADAQAVMPALLDKLGLAADA